MNVDNHNMIKEIQKILTEINNNEIPEIVINQVQINNIFIILKAIKDRKPININVYTKNLSHIITEQKCIECQRKAIYQNLNQRKEMYCWIHSQKFN